MAELIRTAGACSKRSPGGSPAPVTDNTPAPRDVAAIAGIDRSWTE